MINIGHSFPFKTKTKQKSTQECNQKVENQIFILYFLWKKYEKITTLSKTWKKNVNAESREKKRPSSHYQ